MSETIEWVDENGAATNLDDGVNTFIVSGRKGLWMPPMSVVENLIPNQPGSRLMYMNINPRDIDLPFVIGDDSYELAVNRARLLTKSLLYRSGQGKIRVTRVDNSRRELAVVYTGGLDTATNTDGMLQAILTFHAADPFWMATSPIINNFIAGTPAMFFPFFPLMLSSSQIFTDANINNTGDVETWPVWTIHGPGINPIFKNITSGKALGLTVTLLLNEYITIDTRPGIKSIVKNDGTDLFSALSNTSSLWSMVTGDNSVQIEFGGVNSNTSVILSYTPRYLSE